MATIQAHLLPPQKLPKLASDKEDVLEESFLKNRNPQPSDLIILAAEVGLSEEQVRVWFEHRLACWRRSQGLPANGGSVID